MISYDVGHTELKVSYLPTSRVSKVTDHDPLEHVDDWKIALEIREIFYHTVRWIKLSYSTIHMAVLHFPMWSNVDLCCYLKTILLFFNQGFMGILVISERHCTSQFIPATSNILYFNAATGNEKILNILSQILTLYSVFLVM